MGILLFPVISAFILWTGSLLFSAGLTAYRMIRKRKIDAHTPALTPNGHGIKEPDYGRAKEPPLSHPTPEWYEEEEVVFSPVYDGVTIEELEAMKTPDDADVVSDKGFEDAIAEALERDRINQELGVYI